MQSHFPTKRNTKAENLLSVKQQARESSANGVTTEAGKVESGIDVPECVEKLEKLLEQVSDLKLPPHCLDGVSHIS